MVGIQHIVRTCSLSDRTRCVCLASPLSQEHCAGRTKKIRDLNSRAVSKHVVAGLPLLKVEVMLVPCEGSKRCKVRDLGCTRNMEATPLAITPYDLFPSRGERAA